MSLESICERMAVALEKIEAKLAQSSTASAPSPEGPTTAAAPAGERRGPGRPKKTDADPGLTTAPAGPKPAATGAVTREAVSQALGKFLDVKGSDPAAVKAEREARKQIAVELVARNSVSGTEPGKAKVSTIDEARFADILNEIAEATAEREAGGQSDDDLLG